MFSVYRFLFQKRVKIIEKLDNNNQYKLSKSPFSYNIGILKVSYGELPKSKKLREAVLSFRKWEAGAISLIIIVEILIVVFYIYMN